MTKMSKKKYEVRVECYMGVDGNTIVRVQAPDKNAAEELAVDAVYETVLAKGTNNHIVKELQSAAVGNLDDPCTISLYGLEAIEVTEIKEGKER